MMRVKWRGRGVWPAVLGVFLAAAVWALAGQPASAQTAAYDSTDGCTGSWTQQFAVQILILDCDPGYATPHDRAYMYARGPVDRAADWRTQLDFTNAVWIFDAGARGKASLIIDFRREADGLVAEFYDDINDDGEVRYGFERGYPRSVETRFPSLKVIAPDGWWVRDGKINYNLRLLIDGKIYGSYSSDVYYPLMRNDGHNDIEIAVHDPAGNGRPRWELIQARPPVSDSWGILRTLVMYNTADDELPVTTYILWPHLGFMGKPLPAPPPPYRTPLWAIPGAHYGIVKDYNLSFPPIQVDWEKARIVVIGEFVASRGRPSNWFLYSILRFGDNGRTAANFENPFAFYDLAQANDGYPDLAIRDEHYVLGDPHLDPPAFGPLHGLRYSWDVDHSHRWTYKLDMVGRRPMPATIDLGDGTRVQTVPYEEFPRWASSNAWDFVDFIAAERAPSHSTEGIYDIVCDCAIGPYFFGLSPTKPRIDYSLLENGRRGEYSTHLGESPRLYISLIDRKVHLFRAEAGLWKWDEDEQVRYTSTGSAVINQWEHVTRGAIMQSLHHFADRIVYADPGGVYIANAPTSSIVAMLRPPSDPTDYQTFRGQVSAVKQLGDGSDLWLAFDQFKEGRLALPGAAIWDVRPEGAGFRFNARLTQPVPGVPWARDAGPGTYVVTYAPAAGFQMRAANPPKLELAAPRIRGENPSEQIPTRLAVEVRNTGDQDLADVPVVFLVGRPDQASQLIGWTTVSVPATSSAVADVVWSPTISGDWDVSAAVLKSYGASSPPITVKVGAALSTDVATILLAQGLRPFASGAISASLTLAMAIAVGLAVVIWRGHRGVGRGSTDG